MKIVINKCYGGFSISREAAEFMAERGNKRAAQELKENKKRWFGYGYVDNNTNMTDGSEYGYLRTDPDLVAAVEILGAKANNDLSKLKVVEIPDGTDYYIDEYDGMETINEKHESWG